MFSFKTLYIRPRRLLPVFVVVVVLLLILEVAFRMEGWFYDYDGWESPALRKKMEQADELFEKKGRIDLVTLSTSIGRVWDVRQWEEATGDSIVAYNFGYPDQRPERQNFLFQNYIYPKFHPKYVVYGVGAGDLNSNIHGMNPDHPRQGPFWTYRKIRELAADSWLDKATTIFENVSAVFRARKRARFTLQHGPVWMLPKEPTIGHGVLAPTVRRQPFGPMVESWGLKPEGLPNNDYHNYWVPDNGEIGELLKLYKFCEKHDVKLAIVEFPASPQANTNFDNPELDFWRFTNALDHLAANGAWVLPMGRDLKLDNTKFEDQAHMNRWGGQIATNYVYKHVIKTWFPEKAVASSLPSSTQSNFEDLVSSNTVGLEIKRMQPATDDAEYAAPRQVVVTDPVDIPLTRTLSSGSYAVELYAGDGTTTTPELTGAARMELAAVDSSGKTLASMPLGHWINSRIGISYMQADFTVPSTATLMLRVTTVGQRSLILDSAFIRKRLVRTKDKILVK